eukprot:EG_transcript_18229
MAEDNRRKYNNPEAKEQVSEALALANVLKEGGHPQFLGRLWLLLCLNTHTLLDAVTSLMSRRDIQAAYYQPTAFLSQEGNFPALYAMLNQLHKLRFKLFASDVQYFEADIISPVLARESSPVIATIATISRKTKKKASLLSSGNSENGDALQRQVNLLKTSPEAALRLARLDTDSAIDLSDDPMRALDAMSDVSHGSEAIRPLRTLAGSGLSTPGPSDGGKRSGPGSDEGGAGASTEPVTTDAGQDMGRDPNGRVAGAATDVTAVAGAALAAVAAVAAARCVCAAAAARER